MKTDQLMHERESWQSIDYPPKNGARSLSPVSEEHVNGPMLAHRAAWQQVIDQKLMEWARDPSQLQDDRLDPPSAAMIQRAIDFARSLQQAGYPAPTNVVPDANGGIVFHRRQQEFSEEFHFWDDGELEYCRFQETRLVERRQI